MIRIEHRIPSLVIVSVGLACLALFAGCERLRYRLNEQSAQISIKAIRSAEKVFVSNNGKYGTLQELAASGLIESKLATGMNDGYRFDLSVNGKSYKATAVPITYDETGSWSFYVNETGIIRGTPLNRPANNNDQPVRYQE
jgi:hypothetical protein